MLEVSLQGALYTKKDTNIEASAEFKSGKKQCL